MSELTAYDRYVNQLIEISEHLDNEEENQNSVSQDERNEVAVVENAYRSISDELRSAKEIVRNQYQSVRESCLTGTDIRLPMDMRPAETSLSWQTAVKLQESAASGIKEWFTAKTQQALLEKQKRLLEARKRAEEQAKAEAEAMAKAKEAKEQEERRRASDLVENLKKELRQHTKRR